MVKLEKKSDPLLQSLKDLFFAPSCKSCSVHLQSSEQFLCTHCRHHLPLTDYHKNNDNSIKKLFYGRLNLENATALFHFEKRGSVQQLLHNLKYRGDEKISGFLGEWLGHELAQNPKYTTVDLVIPVPIHPKKKKIRGYNQVDGFARAIANHINARYSDTLLIKSKNTKTQVFKGRFTRSDDVFKAFSVSENLCKQNNHILLVDDILTTGATIEACAIQLMQIPNIKLSIAVMAIA